MGSIQIVKSDITEFNTDCIVNSTNTALKASGGVCGAIFKKAGAQQLQDACDKLGGCAVGSVVLTEGFHLKQKYIIHTVGPQWQGGSQDEKALLASCYRNALVAAEKNNCKSIVFPLISSGTYGFPKEEAWDIAVHAIHDYFAEAPGSPLEVFFAVTKDEALEAGNKAVEKYFPKEVMELTGFTPDEVLVALQRIISLTDAENALSVHVGKMLLEQLLALEKASLKPNYVTIELLEAAIRYGSRLFEEAEEFCTYEEADTFESEKRRMRLAKRLYPQLRQQGRNGGSYEPAI